MVIVEQKHHQEPKRQGDKHPLDIQVPKVNEPAPRLRRVESSRDRHTSDVAVLESSRDMGEADPEDGCKLCYVMSVGPAQKVPLGRSQTTKKATHNIGIVSNEAADSRVPGGPRTELLEAVD